MKKFRLFPLILLLCMAFTLLAPCAFAVDDPDIGAQRAVIADLDSGRILYSKNMDEKASPASLTKIMTVLLAVEALENGSHTADELVTAQADCRAGMDETSSTANIQPGEQMRYIDLLYCAMLASANEACNIIAPEHLEVCVEDPFGVLNEIKNAGSIFLGRNVPEALGDYFAGPNHTLPTSGTARFSSPLGVDDFVKKSSFLYYTREALGEVAPRIADFAEREGLHAHAKSVTIRYED